MLKRYRELLPRPITCGVAQRYCQTRNSSQAAIRRDLREGEYNVTTGQKLVYMPDQLGSVRDVIDAMTGTRVASYDYTPYGAVARSSVTNGTDYQYAGLWAHTQSGLNLATFRGQDGVTGRWINRDLIRETGGINLYSYSYATPTNLRDSSGLISNKFKYYCAVFPLLCHPDEQGPTYNPNEPPQITEPGEELPSDLNPYYPDSGDPLDPSGVGTEPTFCEAPPGWENQPTQSPIPSAPIPWWMNIFRGPPPDLLPPLVTPGGRLYNPFDPGNST